MTSEALFSKYDSNKDGVLDKKEAGRIVTQKNGKTFWMKNKLQMILVGRCSCEFVGSLLEYGNWFVHSNQNVVDIDI